MDNMHPSGKRGVKRDDFCRHRPDSSHDLGLTYSLIYITEGSLNRRELPYGQQRYSEEALIWLQR